MSLKNSSAPYFFVKFLQVWLTRLVSSHWIFPSKLRRGVRSRHWILPCTVTVNITIELCSG